MKRTLIALALALAAAVLVASVPPLLTHDYYVSKTTPTKLPAGTGRRSFLIQNQGPNPEWCQLGGDGGTTTVGNGIQLNASGGSWGMYEPEGWPIWCITTSADQVGDGGTILTETR